MTKAISQVIMMFITTLECSHCHAHYNYEELHTVCTICGNTLLVKYDLDTIKETVKKESFATRGGTLWRYFEFLPLKNRKDIITLGEGYTPVLPSRKCESLFIKDESLNPTGTFKARGVAVAVSKAKEFGITDIVMPSAGNAGGALSFYCARAGIKAHVYMPEDSPEVCKRECAAAGADIHFVRGTIKDAGALAAVEGVNWVNLSTLKEPYRLEGKKTMGLEIAEYFNWNPPDVIIYPTGGGTGLIGIWKAFLELEEMGWIHKKSKMIAVQSSGCAPIVKAFLENEKTAHTWENPETVAAGLKVPNPFADRLILNCLQDSKGTAVTVTDEEILQSIRELAQTEGIYACPEGAATYAAYKTLIASKDLSKDERVLLINTGSGLKYPF
jgi:threonine synthase